MRRIIIFLIRKKLGLKKMEGFQFANQKSAHNYYYFNDYSLVKVHVSNGVGFLHRPSSCSLNWLLDKNCKITKMEKETWL